MSVEGNAKCLALKTRKLHALPFSCNQSLTESNRYHWALLTGPKGDVPNRPQDRGVYHVKERLVIEGDPPVPTPKWQYIQAAEEHGILLVRVLVGKVKNLERLLELFRNSPLRPDVTGWNCVYWVKEALETAAKDSNVLASCVGNWQIVRDTAMRYVEEKKEAHRFDGQGQFDASQTATWDLLANKEIVP
ncbi:hypothetical protein PT974_01271 [Cladobotryum mycophilum]|uniref:Uncharacterized protein n=1 Tax=Cladobotryum mycophilum TaxID=491253 RepID=A0ABR0T3H6_9HYPO